MRARPLPVIAAVGAVVVAAVVSTVPAVGAHTEVQRADPSPGQIVAGPVDSIDLLFLDPVLDSVTIVVSDQDGSAVDGLGAVEHSGDGRSATVGFDPLTEPGAYVVEYEFVAVDGDAQSDAYRFTVEADERGASVLGPVLVAGVAAAGLAAVVLALRRRRTGTGTP